MQSPQEYYKHDGPMTALGAHADEFRALPRTSRRCAKSCRAC